MDIVAACITPFQYEARVTDESRHAVIECLAASWDGWPTWVKAVYKHGAPREAKSFREALGMITNEGLSQILYDVYDNGDLAVTSYAKQ